MSQLHIHNVVLCDPVTRQFEQAELWIDKGVFVNKPKDPGLFKSIDGKGCTAIPALVDLGVRLREPGNESVATIASEVEAAAFNGIGTLVCFPDTDPVVDTPAVVESILRRSEQAGFARVEVLASLSQGLEHQSLSPYFGLKDSGCVGLSNAQANINNNQMLRQMLRYAETCELPVVLFNQDHNLSYGEGTPSGEISTRLGLEGVPQSAETTMVARSIELAVESGSKIHLTRITCARSVELIRQAQKQGVKVSADTAIPYVFFSSMDLLDYNSDFKFNPPLRSHEDRDALRQGLADGTLSILNSAHEPCDSEQKLQPFPSASPGASGLDTFLGASYKLVQEGVFDLARMVELCSIEPARLCGHQKLGFEPGAIAHVALVDFNDCQQTHSEQFLSAGKNSPFSGWEFCATVNSMLINGQVVTK